MDQNPKQQVVERIKGATNILVTVSANPSVDQLAACIGFTLLLNKFGKHATAVFSGQIPSTIEFLQPEKTLEVNTDSLQDFIIALDKSKADKLRYKVEDEVVRIFITPYRTSISQKDLEFSQGDFNVDVVVALGVTRKEDIDQAIIAHGRILHDAVVVSVTDGDQVSDVGSINWHDAVASSLSEMLVSVSESFQSGLLDGQMSTAFLTGIVAETERFSNAKTSPKVMTMSAQLMAAGANQQLIATELTPVVPEHVVATPEPSKDPWVAPEPAHTEEAPAAQPEPEPAKPKTDGEVLIEHEEEPPEEDNGEIHIDDQGNLKRQAELEALAREARRAAEAQDVEPAAAQVAPPTATGVSFNDYLVTAPKGSAEPLDSALEPPVVPSVAPAEPSVPLPQLDPSVMADPLGVTDFNAPAPDSLAQLEQDVQSPHVDDSPANLNNARAAVQSASLDSAYRPEPVQSLGAQHIDMGAPQTALPNPSAFAPANATPAMPLPSPTLAPRALG